MPNTINAHADGRASQLRRIAAALPQGYDDLSPVLIAERQFNRGVRRLNLHDGGPTAPLRQLIEDARHGLANSEGLNKALDALEYSLGLPRTAAGPEVVDGDLG